MKAIHSLKGSVQYNLAVILLYALTGHLGLIFAVPPGYATAIWPASGIALGALLVWGLRVLPGIFIASYLLNFYVSYVNCGNNEISCVIWFVGLITGTGAVLQALFGWWLVKKTVGIENPLHLPKDILLFSLLTGLLSCVIASAIGNLGLYFMGTIQAENLAMSWFTWWVGDSIGVLIFTPVFLILFAQPAALWGSRLVPILLPLCLTFFVVFLGHLFYNQSEIRHIQSKFTELTYSNLSRLIDKLKFTLDTEKAVVHLIAQAEELNEKDFNQLASLLLRGNAYVQSIHWAPKITDRKGFESKYPFQIVGNDSVNQNAVYYPVLFSISNIKPFFSKGDDLLSNQDFVNFLKNREIERHRSFFVTFTPSKELDKVYSVSVVSRNNEITGYLLVQIDWSKLFNDSFNNFLQYSNLGFKKISAGNYQDLTFTIYNKNLVAAYTEFVNTSLDFKFAGARWIVLARSSSSYFSHEYTSLVWSSLITSLFFCVMMNIILFILYGQRYLIEFIANARTLQLQEEREKSKLLYNATSEGVLWVDMSYNISFVNPAAEALLGYESDALNNQSISKIFVEPLSKEPNNPIKSLSVYKAVNSKTVIKSKESMFWKANRECIWVEYTCIPIIVNEEVNGAAIIFSDITERIENEEKLRVLAHIDALTCLPNRLSFFEHLEHVIARSQRKELRFAVCFIDVDNFKTINDTYGHVYGDRLLSKLPGIIRPYLQETDYLARVGGDEFALILEGNHKMSDLSNLFKNILNAFSKPIKLDDQFVKTSLSIGIALYPKNASDFETLFRNADIAMYHAKERGKGTFCFFN